MPTCSFCKVGLIVTGEGERDFLPRLFRSLTERIGCSFEVIRRIGQRNPVTSPTRRLRMVGTGQSITTRDEEEIGLPARHFLRGQPCRFVLLIDDAEQARRDNLAAVFERYKTALNTLLANEERSRAAVHFLVNMLEAYYFADCAAVNNALGANILAADHDGDVEAIGHPKGDLKHRFAGFNEREHGAVIVARLDLDHVLNNPTTCAFLRALFEWCVRNLAANCPVYDSEFASRYQLSTGIRAELTGHQ